MPKDAAYYRDYRKRKREAKEVAEKRRNQRAQPQPEAGATSNLEQGLQPSENERTLPTGEQGGAQVGNEVGKEAESHEGRKRRGKRELGPDGVAVVKAVADMLEQTGALDSVRAARRAGVPDQAGTGGDADSHAATGGGSGDGGRGTGPEPADAGSPDLGRGVSVEEQAALLLDPLNFVRTLCMPRLDEWQERVLADCRSPGRTSVRAANGVGKTLLIASIKRYFLATRPNCRVVVISQIYRQLEMMHAHSRSMNHQFIGWELVEGKLRAPNGNEAVWFATRDAGAVESQHAVFSTSLDDWQAWIDMTSDEAMRKKGTLILIRDECKSIPQSVKDASERFQADWTFDFSSPGPQIGWFYDAHTKAGIRDLHRLHHVTAFQSSWIAKKWIDEQRIQYGEDSDLYQSSVMGEFTEAVEGALISLQSVNECMNHPPHPTGHEHVVGADPAWSARGDESAAYERKGNQIFPGIFFREADSMKCAGRLIVELERLKVPRTNIFMDATGGSGVVSRLQEMGWPINGVQFGGSPIANPERYGDRMTELWDQMRIAIEDKKIILPKDDILKAQLTTRKMIPQSSGRLKLESKKEMKKRGLDSPDRADALALALCTASQAAVIKTLVNWDANDDESSYGDRGSRVKVGHTVDGRFDLGN